MVRVDRNVTGTPDGLTPDRSVAVCEQHKTLMSVKEPSASTCSATQGPRISRSSLGNRWVTTSTDPFPRSSDVASCFSIALSLPLADASTGSIHVSQVGRREHCEWGDEAEGVVVVGTEAVRQTARQPGQQPAARSQKVSELH